MFCPTHSISPPMERSHQPTNLHCIRNEPNDQRIFSAPICTERTHCSASLRQTVGTNPTASTTVGKGTNPFFTQLNRLPSRGTKPLTTASLPNLRGTNPPLLRSATSLSKSAGTKPCVLSSIRFQPEAPSTTHKERTHRRTKTIRVTFCILPTIHNIVVRCADGLYTRG